MGNIKRIILTTKISHKTTKMFFLTLSDTYRDNLSHSDIKKTLYKIRDTLTEN